MTTFPLLLLAALCEIGGCFAAWAWWNKGASAWWLLPGLAALAAFATILAIVPSLAAGRTFALYGGVYILASLGWMWWVEGIRPDGFDLAGGALAIAGAGVILLTHPAS